MRGSGHRELIACTFSVMLSIVRSFSSGMSTSDGSIAAVGKCVRGDAERMWESVKVKRQVIVC